MTDTKSVRKNVSRKPHLMTNSDPTKLAAIPQPSLSLGLMTDSRRWLQTSKTLLPIISPQGELFHGAQQVVEGTWQVGYGGWAAGWLKEWLRGKPPLPHPPLLRSLRTATKEERGPKFLRRATPGAPKAFGVTRGYRLKPLRGFENKNRRNGRSRFL